MEKFVSQDPRFLFFIFRFENLISGPKYYQILLQIVELLPTCCNKFSQDDLLQDRLNVGVKTRNIAFSLVLQ